MISEMSRDPDAGKWVTKEKVPQRWDDQAKKMENVTVETIRALPEGGGVFTPLIAMRMILTAISQSPQFRMMPGKAAAGEMENRIQALEPRIQPYHL